MFIQVELTPEEDELLGKSAKAENRSKRTQLKHAALEAAKIIVAKAEEEEAAERERSTAKA